MRKPFSYSVLKYRPSVFLDEQLNIGVLLTFPLERKVVFIAPSQLNRVEYLFPDSNTFELQKLLNQLKKKAYEITLSQQEIGHKALIQTFISDEFEGLYFSKQIDGSYQVAEHTVRYYNKMYFEVYREVFRKLVADS